MKVRYQADNDLRMAIVRGAVRLNPQIDFRSAHAARLTGLPDPEVLALAADMGRILVSHDFQTMPKHFRQFAQDRRSPGVLLVGEAVDALQIIWDASEAEEIVESTLPPAELGHDSNRQLATKQSYAASRTLSPVIAARNRRVLRWPLRRR
jgi:hypothetical protein